MKLRKKSLKKSFKKNFLNFLVLATIIFIVFVFLQIFGPVKEGLLIGPTKVSPYFQNATRASNPDIVITNITFPPQIKAGVKNTINVTVNVTNGNGTAGLGAWNVNVTLFRTIPGGPNISNWGFLNATTTLPGSSSPQSGAADFDLDGDLDVFFSTSTNISIYNNTGVANIATWQLFNVTTGKGSHAFGDFDADNDTDVVVAQISNDITIYNNTRNVNITQWNSFSNLAPGTANSVAVGDLDNDGDLDVVSMVQENGVLTSWNNTGTVNLAQWGSINRSPGFITTSTSYHVVVADFDNNGWNDIAFAGIDNISILNNTGTLDIRKWDWFNMTATLADSATPRVTRAADFDNDGDLDLASVTTGGTFIFNNTGTSNIAQWNIFSRDPQNGIGLNIADFNYDGYLDLATAAGNILTIPNNTGPINFSQCRFVKF
ncbi:TPA: VCBS repeat-containing protein, partial [archaeon]|nr:VCBS repeat-containing protein [Candidatus Naiadarchaeum limnaeum]